MTLRVPDHVRWSDDGSGCLAIADERTGGYCRHYNHECLAIFVSVAGTGGLEAAVTQAARRLGISRKSARVSAGH